MVTPEELDRLRDVLSACRRVKTPGGFGEIVARIAPRDETAFVLPDGGGPVREWALTLIEPVVTLNPPAEEPK